MSGALRGLFAAAVVLGAVAGGCDERAPVEDAADGAAPDMGLVADAGAADAAVEDAAVEDAATDAGADAEADAAPPAPDAEVADAALDPVDRPLAATGPWGPAARISTLDMPANADAARRVGCLLRGPAVGTKLYSILLLAGGGLGAQVRPGAGGRIELVLLMRARGWPAGRAAAGLDAVDLDVIAGVQGEGSSFRYRADAFADDPSGPARSVFAESFVRDGWLDTDQISLTMPLSLLGSPQVPFTLEQARLTGRIVAAGPGFALESGAIAGYFTLDQLVMLIQEVQRFCGADDPPGICALIGDQFEQPLDALVDVIVGFVDGLEVRLDGPRVLDCDPALPDDCNAVGVCLRIEATPVVVEGVAAP
ncbi:MAG: hypothetical protein R3F65_01445 [bacterium]